MSANEVDLISVGTSRLETRVHLSQPSLLVFSIRHDPGWRAYVDGVRREVYQANGILMAVPVESGKHTVEFVYAPESRAWNLGVRTLTPLLAAGLVFLKRHAKRRSDAPETSGAIHWLMLALSGLALASFVPAQLQAQIPERASPPLSQVVDATFGDLVRLEGVIVDDEAFASTGQVELTLHWRDLQSMDASYSVFVHVVGPDGAIHTQRDVVPLNGGYPTNIWQPGELVADHHSLTLPRNAPPGEYRLVVGLYDPGTMQRLPAFKAQGGRWDGDGVWLDARLFKPER